ncbi:MAG: hypothetical protein MUC50_19210 [Myxococcota bacterium]|jgi:hypothetical protein|nr:hypothetical protein [Myxococcota bacterium]
MTTFFDEPTFLKLLPRRTIKGPAEEKLRSRVKTLPMGSGWTSLAPDPMKLLRHYPTLKMKSGWVLKAYQHYERGNGHCLVFAWPKSASLPEPYDVLPFEKRDPHWAQPCPEGSVVDFMTVIDGDGSPESYLMASFFSRDVEAIGAFWHGGEWLDHHVLFADPIASKSKKAKPYEDAGLRPGWRRRARFPVNLEPCVSQNPGETEVAFHTYCPVGWRAITRFVDRFGGDGMRFETRNTLLATAPGGIVH